MRDAVLLTGRAPKGTIQPRQQDCMPHPSKLRKTKMAGIKDILEIEKMRTSVDDWRQVNLFQEGSFYRAYEVSAWLCCCHLHEFKVTNRNMKGIEQLVTFVGFPLTSIEKWKPAEAQVTQVAEKQMLLTLPTSVWTDGTDVKNLEEVFMAWKSDLPLSETSSHKVAEPTKEEGAMREERKGGERVSLFSVAHDVLEFPLERKSPIDCMLFLADIRQKLATIL